MSAFTVTDASTWPEVLSLPEVAAIYRMTPSALRHALKPTAGVFMPRPFLRRPARWRKADILRHIEGARRSLRRAS